MSQKSDEYSRDLFLTFAVLSAVPLQAGAIWVHPVNSWVDWGVLVLLCLIAWAHIDGARPDPD